MQITKAAGELTIEEAGGIQTLYVYWTGAWAECTIMAIKPATGYIVDSTPLQVRFVQSGNELWIEDHRAIRWYGDENI